MEENAVYSDERAQITGSQVSIHPYSYPIGEVLSARVRVLHTGGWYASVGLAFAGFCLELAAAVLPVPADAAWLGGAQLAVIILIVGAITRWRTSMVSVLTLRTPAGPVDVLTAHGIAQHSYLTLLNNAIKLAKKKQASHAKSAV